jgi:2'-5' RNA ligase
MKSIIQSIPGYRINEYMIVLHPPEDLRGKIGQIKKEFSETYKTGISGPGKSHIMLAGFSQYAMMEERVVNRLKTVAMGFRPFKVELKDFGSYPSHSIYINITTKEPVRNLVKEIKGFQQLLKLNKDQKAHFLDDPNILIARRLIPWQYEKGWQEFSHRQFTGRFVADSMLLVKRRQGEKAWQIVERMEFMNLPVTTRQGELF